MTARRDTLSRDTYLALVRLNDRLEQDFQALFKDAGLTQAHFNVLRILLGGPREGAPCQYIGERLLRRVPDVTRLVDRMVAAGLVTRERSAEDRRVVRVKVTAKGRRVARQLEAPVAALHCEQFAHLPVQTLAALKAGLEEALERA